MAQQAAASVHVEYVGHELGHWCLTCMLSTGVRLWWTSTLEGSTTELRAGVWCIECDGENIEISADAVDVTGQLGEDDEPEADD